MKKITVFQCIPAYKPLPTSRLINSITNNSDTRILLDIEDSIWDVQNSINSSQLKKQARLDLVKIIENSPNILFDLRINPINGCEFLLDKELLHQYKKHFQSIFIPKVENASDIEYFTNIFSDCFKINPIIETEKGLKNLNKILSSKILKNIEYIFFGNYDYHLDENIYPIQEQNTESYWKLINPIIKKIESKNLMFGNSPYANLNDKDCLDYSLQELNKECNNNFAVMSLHKKQTYYYLTRIEETKPKTQSFPQKNIRLNTESLFIKNKLKGRSFAIDSNNRIITPQEYLLLLKQKNA